jgi:carnitine 3-dehydrogenase
MHHGTEGHVLATGEQMLVHVDMRQGRAAPMPAYLHERVAAIYQAHRALARPAQAGAPIGIRRKAA